MFSRVTRKHLRKPLSLLGLVAHSKIFSFPAVRSKKVAMIKEFTDSYTPKLHRFLHALNMAYNTSAHLTFVKV